MSRAKSIYWKKVKSSQRQNSSK